MAASEVDICNLALAMLGQNPIVDLNEGSRAAGLCKSFYAPLRDELLRGHPWNFAIVRVLLAADSVAPVSDYTAAFTLPVDCLRVLKVVLDHPLTDWQIEGRKVVANASGPLSVIYLARVTDTGLYPPDFVTALAARLAWQLAMPFSDSATLAQEMQRQFKIAVAAARGNDAREGMPGKLYADTFLESRV